MYPKPNLNLHHNPNQILNPNQTLTVILKALDELTHIFQNDVIIIDNEGSLFIWEICQYLRAGEIIWGFKNLKNYVIHWTYVINKMWPVVTNGFLWRLTNKLTLEKWGKTINEAKEEWCQWRSGVVNGAVVFDSKEIILPIMNNRREH